MSKKYADIISFINTKLSDVRSSEVIGTNAIDINTYLASHFHSNAPDNIERSNIIYATISGLNALMCEVDNNPAVPTLLEKDEKNIETLYLWLISELPKIKASATAKFSKLLSETSMRFYDFFNADRLLDNIYLKDDIGGLGLVLDAMYIKGDLGASNLLTHKYLLFASESIKTYVLQLLVDAQKSDNILWWEESLQNGDCDNCGTYVTSLCNLYNSLESPSRETTALFLSLSNEIDSTKAMFDDYCESHMCDTKNSDIARMYMSGYRIFTKTRELILGHDCNKTLALAQSLNVSDDYQFWLGVVSKDCDTSKTEAIEFTTS